MTGQDAVNPGDGPQLKAWFSAALQAAGVLPGAGRTADGDAEDGDAALDDGRPNDRSSGEGSSGGRTPGGRTPGEETSGEGASGEGAVDDAGTADQDPIGVRVGSDAAGAPVVDVPAAGWSVAATCARDQLGFDFLDWLSAVDEPDAAPAGLDIVLHLAATDSFGAGARTVRRLLLRTRIPDADLQLPSLTGLWPGVAWHERETAEMFGVDFTDFDDGTGAGLRPLLLPDGFEGTPLRKSFVLAARVAKSWPGAKDPGDSGKAAGRRRTLPPGVPDPSWGPHEPQFPEPGTDRG